jgi:hypothetical protein
VLQQELEAVDIAIEEHGGRITVMEEHLKNVRQEITYTESRVRCRGGRRGAAAPAGAATRQPEALALSAAEPCAKPARSPP